MDLKALLIGIATIGGILLTFAAIFLYGVSKVSDNASGQSEGKMMGCAIGAVACYAAAGYIATQNLTITG